MNKTNFFSKNYAKLVSSYPAGVLVVIFCLLIFSAFNLSNFKLDASSDSLVLENDDDLRYTEKLTQIMLLQIFLLFYLIPTKSCFRKKPFL